MEKFLFVFKLSKGAKIIGWLKLVLNSLFALLCIIGLIFAKSIADMIRKMFGIKEESNVGV